MDRFSAKIGLVKEVNVVSKTSKAIILLAEVGVVWWRVRRVTKNYAPVNGVVATARW